MMDQIWKFATGAAACVAAALCVALVFAHLENRSITAQLTKLEHRINDPQTGLVAQLAQSETNVATVRTALATQNKILTARSEQDAETLRATSGALADSQRHNRDMLLRMTKMMALPPKGPTIEDRYQDIDNRLVESLK